MHGVFTQRVAGYWRQRGEAGCWGSGGSGGSGGAQEVLTCSSYYAWENIRSRIDASRAIREGIHLLAEHADVRESVVGTSPLEFGSRLVQGAQAADLTLWQLQGDRGGHWEVLRHHLRHRLHLMRSLVLRLVLLPGFLHGRHLLLLSTGRHGCSPAATVAQSLCCRQLHLPCSGVPEEGSGRKTPGSRYHPCMLLGPQGFATSPDCNHSPEEPQFVISDLRVTGSGQYCLTRVRQHDCVQSHGLRASTICSGTRRRFCVCGVAPASIWAAWESSCGCVA